MRGEGVSIAREPGAGGTTAVSCRRVLGLIGGPLSGVGYVRFVQPFEQLRSRGFELATLPDSLRLTRGPGGYEPDPALLDGVSLLVFPQMVLAPVLADGSRVNVVRPLCAEARRRGIPIVYSVDDYLPEIEEHNPEYERIRGSHDNLRAILDEADAILATTEPLRESLAPLGKPVHLLPNAIDPARWRLRPRRADELRVGWAGSGSHLDDLRMLLPALRQLQRRVECRFVMLGLTDLPLGEQVRRIKRDRRGYTRAQRSRAERFLEVARQLRGLRHEHVPFRPMDRYFEALPALDLDLGVCPLLDAPFNRHKSAIKFYEYAATGTMTVASDVPSYRDEVSVTVPDDAGAWCDALEHWLRDDRARDEELERQRAFVLEHRNIEKLADRWAGALESILEETK